MGRHSAPATDDDDRPSAPAASPTRAPRPARHADAGTPTKPRPAAAPVPAAAAPAPAAPAPAAEPAGGLDLIEDALYGGADTDPAVAPTAPTAPVAPTAEPTLDPVRPAPRPVAPTVAPAVEPASVTPPVVATGQSDRALLRAHRDVRARVAAAVVVPFVVYAVVLLSIGSFGWRVFLIWSWVPLVTAGVIVGLFLDAGHRTYTRGAPAEPVADPSTDH